MLFFDKSIIHGKPCGFNTENPPEKIGGIYTYLMEKEIIVPAPFLAISTENAIPPPMS